MKETVSFPKNRWRVLVLGLALSLVVVLVYLPVRHFDFLNWDDRSYVVDNDPVRAGITWNGIIWSFMQIHSGNWHPLTWLSHMVDCELHGVNAGWHHLTNVFFHGANAALLFWLLHLLTGSVVRSLMVAALFALHPLRVESVAWISERKDLLSACFGLLCLLAYVHYVRFKAPVATPVSKNRKRVWYGLALLLFAAALMSKPMLVTWPCVMLLLDYWPLRRFEFPAAFTQFSSIKRCIREKLPFFVLATASCIITVLAQKQGGAVLSLEHVPFGARLQNALGAYAAYLANFFWPANLSPIYPLTNHVDGWRVGAAVLTLALLTVGAWLGRKRREYLMIGWLWFLGTLVPVIGLVQVGSAAYADRYTYIPGIGLAMAVVWLLADLVSSLRFPRLAIAVCAGIVLVMLAWRTEGQITIWRNTETLFRRTLALYPDCVPALYGLGEHLVGSRRFAEAKPLLEKVIQLQPAFAGGWGVMADLRDGEGDYKEAIRNYHKALDAQPDHPIVLNNLAWLLASCPDATLRDGPEAVRFATRACELTGYAKPVYVGTLAAAQAAAGDFKSAIASAERAAALAIALRQEEIAMRNRAMVELYRQGKAAHGGIPSAR